MHYKILDAFSKCVKPQDCEKVSFLRLACACFTCSLVKNVESQLTPLYLEITPPHQVISRYFRVGLG